jgi:hypothetical protein
VVVGASAVAAIATGVRWHRPARRLPWGLIAAAQCLFVAGDALFSFNELVLGIEPFPSLAYPVGDVLLLALAARLATTPGRRTAAFRLPIASLAVTMAADTLFSALTVSGRVNGRHRRHVPVCWLGMPPWWDLSSAVAERGPQRLQKRFRWLRHHGVVVRAGVIRSG